MKDLDFVGIDVGSINLKLCGLGPQGTCVHGIAAHEGDLEQALTRLLDQVSFPSEPNGTQALVTGTEGRHRLRLPEVIAPSAIEHALEDLGLKPRAVVSMGGEDLVLYVLDSRGRIVNSYSGNKCASGTGEFFRQQLGRMDLGLDNLEETICGAKVQKLSCRCSVFMKSDCTHRLNKGEATKGDIVLSLSKLMADKISEFLTKANIRDGAVVLAGGVTQNLSIGRFLGQTWPDIEFVVPEQAAYLEAYGAAVLARRLGKPLPARSQLLGSAETQTYGTFPSLNFERDRVRYVPSVRGRFDPEAEYILGVDGGSTTTKIALVDARTFEVVAAHYGRTHGDPVAALKRCAQEVKQQIGGVNPRIILAATTGSSRELLGVFLETAGVYNEIIAHTVGTLYFEPQVDTLFEIGGQDAKYVFINNGVPIDYAMNEACSAGTGSFLEESAQGDLSISQAIEIGPIALEAKAPLKFGEHCSAFINSDIRKAIQQGWPRADIAAGLVFSIVSNYVNRVVGNRSVGSHVVLQGGVAKNPAVPLAFAYMLDKPIVVAPDPELMGCFGVARLAKQKLDEGLLQASAVDLDAVIDKKISYQGAFKCKACENVCEIRKLRVGAQRYPFGGRCSKYTNARKKLTPRRRDREVIDYTAVRTKMLFEDYAPKPNELVARTHKIVGVPLAFSVHSLWPFYSWFFHTLGVRTVLSKSISPLGIAKQESNYCFPAEIAHGTIQDVLEQNVDYVFLPHFRDMPPIDKDLPHACTCPLTQGLPFFARPAFALDDTRILRPLVSLLHGWEAARPAFAAVAERLGFSGTEADAAFDRGVRQYESFVEAYRQLGRQVLSEIRANPDTLHVALLGRPYNAFTRDANMGIPRKLTSQGVTVVPFDMIFDLEAKIFPNMYWHYGQQDMKAVATVKEVPGLYLTWISNFSCAPDSFMLHYVRWMMGQKPYLVLEIDSHTADAGIDTRVEAFLDIVESYRSHNVPQRPEGERSRYSIALKREYCDVVDHQAGARIDIRDPRVTMVWPSMGEYGVQALAAAARKQGIKAVHLPVPDSVSTQLARKVASGKECIPSLLVLGSIMQFFQEHPPNREDEIWVVVVPSTVGPCRTGQYFVFYERVFADLGWKNVVQLVAGSENSYREMGPTFSRDVWRSIVMADYLTDIRTGIELLAKDVEAGLEICDRVWEDLLQAMAGTTKELDRALKRAGTAFAKIPKQRTLDELRKVLVVGEIYVRRDDFSVGELRRYLISRGIFPKVTGVSEWVNYTDYARGILMGERFKREGWRMITQEGGLKETGFFFLEWTWKRWVENRIRSYLMPTGFIPDFPHDMRRVIDNARRIFIDPELESEATVSSAVAAAAMEDGYSGISVIAPFGCLPGRLIEGVYAPWAKARGYPVIALENDGQCYPPNIVSRLEVFAHNVLRYERHP